MGSIGLILRGGLKITTRVPKRKVKPFEAQEAMLIKLLRKAQFTDFGSHYNFTEILYSGDIIKAFQEKVPIHTYEKIFQEWWQTALTGEKNVAWPGKVNYWALSSGTSAGSSKNIPITKSMLKAIQRASIYQLLALGNCNLPDWFYERGFLMLGGSTNLEFNGIHYAGDLSGITTGNIPFWFQPYYKPGKEISETKNWQEKLDKIVEDAHNWDLSGMAGNPAWFQILLERIIAHYKLNNIHELWPNLLVFSYGAVAFEPHRKSFEKLLGNPLIYLETYLASEGFIAYQDRPNAKGMKLIVKNGIFYEFIPFNEENIDQDGNINPKAKALHIGQVEENKDYIILMSTVSGAWRYILGDVIRFVDLSNRELKIMGRTKFYLSLVGEHLSVENINKAIEQTSKHFNFSVKEFTVAGVKTQQMFGHHYFLSAEGDLPSNEEIAAKIDEFIKTINDDYKVERGYGISEVKVDIIPNQYFIDWLKSEGKEGAQVKFPRVLKGERLASWKKFIEERTPIKINLIDNV